MAVSAVDEADGTAVESGPKCGGIEPAKTATATIAMRGVSGTVTFTQESASAPVHVSLDLGTYKADVQLGGSGLAIHTMPAPRPEYVGVQPGTECGVEHTGPAFPAATATGPAGGPAVLCAASGAAAAAAAGPPAAAPPTPPTPPADGGGGGGGNRTRGRRQGGCAIPSTRAGGTAEVKFMQLGITLFGADSIVGRAVVLKPSTDQATWRCANIRHVHDQPQHEERGCTCCLLHAVRTFPHKTPRPPSVSTFPRTTPPPLHGGVAHRT